MNVIPRFVVCALGRRDYLETLALQRRLVAARRAGEGDDTLLLVEHPPVVTVGRRRGAREHLLALADTPVVEVERGGDVTWHGPGQLVGYPIFALAPHERDAHGVLRRLEGALIAAIGAFGLEGERRDGLTGVWCRGKKLASLGVAIQHWITFHGFALNVDPDLAAFRQIAPCGLDAGVMGSMASVGGEVPSRDALVEAIVAAIADAFGRDPVWSHQDPSPVGG